MEVLQSRIEEAGLKISYNPPGDGLYVFINNNNNMYFYSAISYTGCLKKNATEIQQAVVHHKLNKTILFLHRTKELLFSFSMIPFLNRNDEKWPHARQIKIVGRNHILPPLGIESTLIMQS
jgi:hypothetical protein